MRIAVRRGAVYALAVGGEGDPGFVAPTAKRVLVLSEDLWNDVMDSSVIVPIYRREEVVGEHAARLQPAIDDDHYADCTLVQSIDHDDLGDFDADAEAVALDAVAAGVRAYLDIDDVVARRIKRPPAVGRSTFWPRQRGIHWGRRFGEQRERYLVVADDEFNVRADHTAAMFSDEPRQELALAMAGTGRWRLRHLRRHRPARLQRAGGTRATEPEGALARRDGRGRRGGRRRPRALASGRRRSLRRSLH